MILSMTGYGESSMIFAGYKWRCIIQSVNSRYLDCRVKLPSQFSYAEPKIRVFLKKHLLRGKVDIYFNVSPIEEDAAVSFFERSSVVDFCRSGLSTLQDLGWDDKDNQLRSVILQAAFQSGNADSAIIVDADSVVDGLLELTSIVVECHQMSCKTEGKELLVFFQSSLHQLECIFSRLICLANDMCVVFVDRLKSRISSLLDQDLSLDESRLSQEVAFLVDKSDITEEITRFQSHIKQFSYEIDDADDIRKGKKLDFIIQEMLREINTIGSKANLLEITQLVISVKNILESMREQVQNVV